MYNDTVWEYRKELPELAEDITRLQVPVENREKGVIGITALLADDQGREITRSHFRYWVIDKNKTVRNPLFGYENRSDVFPVWAVKLTEKIYCEMGAGFQRNFYWGEKYTTFDASSADFLQYLNVKNSLITAPLNMTVINYLYRDSLIAYYNKDYLTKPFALSPDAFKTELTRWGNGFTGILELNKGVITHFEIINELNLNRIKFETAPSKETVIMTADRYIELLKIARACINQTAPKVKIGSCFCRIDLPYIKMLIDAGMLNYIDFLSFHLYQGTPETPPVYEQLAELKSLIQSKKNDLPVYNSEQYFGYRNFLNVWSEYDKAYYSDFEDDYVGRIIQNYLHHSANNIPLALFAAPETAFLPGISSPVYYQYTVGAYRNLSQLLNGIEKGKSLDLKKNLRSFLFERTDQKKIVSFNMKDYGKTGTIIRSPLWEQVLDINGNPVNKNDIDISYLPCYAIYPEKVSSEAVIADVRSLDYFGFNSPFQTECVIARDGTILIRSSNASGKPQSEEIIFESLPAAWSSVPSLQMSNAAPGKWFEKSLGRLEPDRDWRLAYNLQYRESYKDGEDVILKKLPSFDIPFRAGISIDGSLAEWKSARRLLLDENNLSKDFSQGKDKHSGTDDLSAEIALCWDSDNLYIALKVRDNTAMPLAKTAGSLYNNDSVQVYLDLNNDNVSQEFKAYDYNDALYQIGFYQGSDKPIAYLEKNPSGRYIGEANMEKGIDPDVKIAYSKTESGYLYEIAFPATTLPNLLLGSGSELGIDILINDNDGSGRKQALTLGAIGKEPHYNSFLWKSARLIKD
ncbi:MAG TPA: hypothetical protein DC049_13950 [Spirochaetia bacterium]|nr:hypothetical protein [Spirochaetia bacterium]